MDLDLDEPWTGHRDPDTGRAFYGVTKDSYRSSRIFKVEGLGCSYVRGTPAPRKLGGLRLFQRPRCLLRMSEGA